jgi:hypothetical protein
VRKTFLAILIMLFLCLLITPFAFSWGFFAHKRINRMAIFTLPPEMIGFYKKHIDFIAEHAVDPDKRRFRNEDEAPRHYIDIDHFGISPFDSMPHQWTKAAEKYTEDTLKAHGILPWHLERMLISLTNAFKEQEAQKILHVSAELGHYLADAHVPLHTSKNHDGQLTNQKGIHAFWESRIPELKADTYDYFTGRAEYIDKPQETIWKIIKASHAAVDSVLTFEAKLNEQFGADKKYSFETKGKKTVKNYSEAYTQAYDEMLNGMVERRMRSAIYMIGCFWYTAWVNAGQPDLNKLDDKAIKDPQVKKQDSVAVKIGAKLLKGHEE